jgi:hypothetical protein
MDGWRGCWWPHPRLRRSNISGWSMPPVWRTKNSPAAFCKSPWVIICLNDQAPKWIKLDGLIWFNIGLVRSEYGWKCFTSSLVLERMNLVGWLCSKSSQVLDPTLDASNALWVVPWRSDTCSMGISWHYLTPKTSKNADFESAHGWCS